MSDVVPLAEDSSSSGAKRALLAVGVIGLLIAGIFAALTVGGSTTAASGADTPEDAVLQMLDALENEDFIGAAELLLPSERESLVEPTLNMIDELKRLEVLDPELDLSAFPGVDLGFEGVELESTTVSDRLVNIKVVGGTSTSEVDQTLLPLGRLVLDRLPTGTLTDEISSSTESLDPDGAEVVVVLQEGKWYVSLWYSVAEAARIEAGLPLPNPAQAVVARGADSAEAAVEALIRAGIDLDARRALELLAPSEAAVLQEYAPLFLADTEEAARDARREMRQFNIDIDLRRLDLSSQSRGDDRIVTFDGGELIVTSDVVDFSLEVSNGSATAEVVMLNEEVRFELTIIGDCFELEIRDLSGEVLELMRECADDIEKLFDQFAGGEVFVGGLPDFNIFTENPVLGIAATEENGEWFVSPLGTLLDSQVEVLSVVDQQKLEDLIDWFIDQAENNPLMAGIPL